MNAWLGLHRQFYLLGAAGCCLLTFCGYAHAKVPWMDEVLLLTIARLRGMRDIMAALMDGIQTDPPALQAISHYLFRFFGDHVFLARLPAIFGFCLMCVSLSILIWRHAPPVYAAATFFLPYATALRAWSMDARPYGMMMGFSALALLCWDAVGDPKSDHRTRWRIGFTLSLAAALSTHFYSILLLAPLAAGELTRWTLRKRIDWRTAGCVALALIPYVIWLPILFSGMRVYHVSSQLHGKASLETFANFYAWAIASLPMAGLLCLMLAALAARGRMPADDSAPASLSDGDRALLAAAAGFLVLPAIGYAVGATVAGFFIVYYHMISIFGVILGLPLLLALVARRSRLVGLCLLAAAGAQGAMVTARGLSGFIRRDAGYPTLAAMRALIPESHPDIVVDGPALFLPMREANRFDREDNLVFLFDSQKELAELGTSTADILYRQLRPYTSARIEPWDSYTAAHPTFYLAAPSQGTIEAWRHSYLVKRAHAGLWWLGQTGGFDLFRVELRRER